MIYAHRKHPEILVFLDRKRVVTYYGPDDPRNDGEIALEAKTDTPPFGDFCAAIMPSIREIVAKYNGDEFKVDMTKMAERYREHRNGEQTRIVEIVRAA